MQVQLTRGRTALIDDDDWLIVSQFRWYATPNRMGGYYAAAHISGTTLYMHRLITGASKGKEVDHLNHDTLDNRRQNLRVGSHHDNMANGTNAHKTHCPKGHAYDERNTWVSKRNQRICRKCNAERVAAIIAKETPEQRERRLKRMADNYRRKLQQRC